MQISTTVQNEGGEGVGSGCRRVSTGRGIGVFILLTVFYFIAMISKMSRSLMLTLQKQLEGRRSTRKQGRARFLGFIYIYIEVGKSMA